MTPSNRPSLLHLLLLLNLRTLLDFYLNRERILHQHSVVVAISTGTTRRLTTNATVLNLHTAQHRPHPNQTSLASTAVRLATITRIAISHLTRIQGSRRSFAIALWLKPSAIPRALLPHFVVLAAVVVVVYYITMVRVDLVTVGMCISHTKLKPTLRTRLRPRKDLHRKSTWPLPLLTLRPSMSSHHSLHRFLTPRSPWINLKRPSLRTTILSYFLLRPPLQKHWL
jgi:hypothetical protein